MVGMEKMTEVLNHVYHPLYNQLWNGSDDLTIIDVDGFLLQYD